jgi:uncharacterized protein (DUF302 family)
MKSRRKETAKLTVLVSLGVLFVLLSGCSTAEQSSETGDSAQMFYIVETAKSFEQASTDLEAAVTQHGFGVLQIHDIGKTLRSKGMEFDEECRVFEVCNPQQATRVLSADMSLNMALPCRISVYTEGGQTKIGMIRPQQILAALSEDRALAVIAREVEAKTIQMIKDTK